LPPYTFAKNGRAQPSWPWLLLQSASFCAGSENPPLMRFILKYAPLPFLSCASSPGKQASLRPGPARVWAWAVLVVSHHLDGLLRTGACGFVAPRIRFWGSLCFTSKEPDDGRSCPLARGDDSHNAVRTPRRIPLVSSRAASLRSLPSCCYPPLHTARDTEVLLAAGRAVPKNVRGPGRSLGHAVAVWRSRLASQSEVPVSGGHPKMPNRGGHEASSVMP
jgi:hypothetical protein